MFDTLFLKKLENAEQKTVSGWSGRRLGFDLTTKVNDRLYACLEEVPYLQSKSVKYDDLVDKSFYMYN